MTLISQTQWLRFAIVGLVVAATYIALFVGFLAIGMGQAPANVIAFLTAVGIQYILQTTWTFRQKLVEPFQMARFGVTIMLGVLVSTYITVKLAPSWGWTDWFAAFVVAVFLPVQNFLLMKLWVFTHPNE